ncbi:MAG: discoidin domain-containing protein, partial [Bacteroidales bacterium]|nr:discoidin domain-containing protein [Bacteroidales bacterium]
MTSKKIFWFAVILFVLVSFLRCKEGSEQYTRGVGEYPGNPDEDFSPSLVADHENYRNLAKHRKAYHSSSYDYNLTAQLVTDGMITDEHPHFISLATSEGVLPKNRRERLLDHNSVTEENFEGEELWLQLELKGSLDVPEVTKISVNGDLTYDDEGPKGWEFVCMGSNDGKNWNELGKDIGSGLPGQGRPGPSGGEEEDAEDDGSPDRPANPFAELYGHPEDTTPPEPSFGFDFNSPENQRVFKQSFSFDDPVSYRFYKVHMKVPSAKEWSIGDYDFFNRDTELKMVPSHNFKSAWMSSGKEEEWVYVDLGTSGTFDRIKLHWINKPANGVIQVSEDAETWDDLVTLPDSDGQVDDISLSDEAQGRYVRVLMTEPASDQRYILSEMEVFGKGGLVPKPKDQPEISDNRMDLAGGNWKIRRASRVTSTGNNISRVGFENNDWMVATVPATALVSYWNAGALPDPNFGDNQLMISESFFNSDFWYRNEFEVPSDFTGERMFLNFDGINWKAEVFVNGKKTGTIEGAFTHEKFDVTDYIIPGEKNAMAVRIIKNANIGVVKEQTLESTDRNGGVLGADNPTFHASIGWDWIPTIRGRNIGIWNDVYLNATGPVTIEDPYVYTDLDLPDTTAADINMEVTLQNHKAEAVSGTLTGKYGDISIEEEVSLEPSESKMVKLNPSTHPSLHFESPKLWWPNGYGQPHLYNVDLGFSTADGKVSDEAAFKSGVREMTFKEEDEVLSMYINGRRFIGRGGNWGFSESNLEYRAREYDIAVAYHEDMNFTMIRNWVGQTGDEEFYEACDRHGIMVWQDFWLANPVDGPDPNDPDMFMDNARNMVKRIRNHPSLAIYCGRNEGNPPEVLDTALRSMISEIHPELDYISNSSSGGVSGHGPYRALPPRNYYLLYGYNTMHTERGMPNVMPYESLDQTLPESALWPQNYRWGLHDYCMEAAQGAASFNEMIEKGFGFPDNARKFTELAQWINYNGYRAMFESRSPLRKGLLLWMSHPAWPSMVWQTYDYYFEPTAAYFGCKKASEPLHIQWQPVYDEIEVVNYHAGDREGLTAKARLINMDGSVQWEKEKEVDIEEDNTIRAFALEFP